MKLQNIFFSLIIALIPISSTAQRSVLHPKSSFKSSRTNAENHPSSPGSSASCAHPAPNTCTFYSTCLERVYHCGPTGYPLAFGKKYCTKTLKYRSFLSPSGQSWSTNAMLCLQEQFVPLLSVPANEQTDCVQLEKDAIATHAGCFVRNGICSLGLQDWEVIVGIIWPALFSDWRTWVSAGETAEECVGFKAWLVLKQLL